MARRPLLLGIVLGLLMGVALTRTCWHPAPIVTAPPKASPPVTYAVPTGTVVAPPTHVPTVPPDWQPREFNGHTYYIVPLAVARR